MGIRDVGTRVTRLLAATVGLATVLSAGFATAHAAEGGRARPPSAATAPCQPVTSPAVPFADQQDFRPYVMIPGGDFEADSGRQTWTTSGAARIAPAHATRDRGETRSSLVVARGGSATSPTTCPTWPGSLRFAVNDPGLADASLKIDVTVADGDTGTVRRQSVTVRSTGPAGWRLVGPIPLDTGPGAVSVRVVNDGIRTWSVDDVYVSDAQLQNGMPFRPR